MSSVGVVHVVDAAVSGPGDERPVAGPPLPGLVLRGRSWSARLDVRSVVVCSSLLAVTVVVAVWSVMVGDFPLSVGQVLRSVTGDGGPDAEFVVQTLRLPRALTAVLVGAALGMSGAVFQSIARNPLGSPDIIGFESGAAAGAVLMITAFGASETLVAGGAVAGGGVTALAVYLLSCRGGLSVSRLVLVGIGVGFAASAAVDFMITRAQIHDVQRSAVWLTGSLNGRTWEHVRTIGIPLLVLAPAVVAACRALDRLALGDDVAAALGVRVGRTRSLLVLFAVVLSSLAVAAAGPIVFVAFVSAPIARRLTATAGAAVVPSALVGAALTVAADLAARRVFAPTEFPVGITTAVSGAPYLLWLLTRRVRTGAL